MAVRKIGVSDRSVTGRHGFSGQQYESTLERDFLDLIEFDCNVDRYETQPLTIIYVDGDGRVHGYTPDVFVQYRRDIVPARDMPHLLVEIKYREDYRGQFRELKQRLRAARLYARERGWRFAVLTEREIRTPYLRNARFLRPYRDVDFEPWWRTGARPRRNDPCGRRGIARRQRLDARDLSARTVAPGRHEARGNRSHAAFGHAKPHLVRRMKERTT